MLLRRALAEDGYAVDHAADGHEALCMGQENDYDAIVLDAMPPGLDGFEVVRRWRAAQRWAPVLMPTARTAVGARIEGLDAGADDYLAKTFAFGELSARLRSLVRRGAAERPVVLRAGDLLLDPAARRVTRAAKRVELTAKEFSLLELLMRRGDVLSRGRKRQQHTSVCPTAPPKSRQISENKLWTLRCGGTVTFASPNGPTRHRMTIGTA
jgi:two-component system OmpR family response regulator